MEAEGAVEATEVVRHISRVLPPFGHRRLRGAFPLKLDRTGRISIPGAFRHAFIPGDAECVMAPMADRLVGLWAPLAFDLLIESGRGDETRAIAQPKATRWIEMTARDVSIDTQYRVVIPPEIRDEVDLGERIVLAGSSDRIEIWNEEQFRQERDDSQNDTRDWINNREVM